MTLTLPLDSDHERCLRHAKGRRARAVRQDNPRATIVDNAYAAIDMVDE